MIFSALSLIDKRSSTLAPLSAEAGTTLVGPASARMIGGSPLRAVPVYER